MAIQRWKPRQLRRWDPFREMEEAERRFDELFGFPLARHMPGEREWAPAIDMFEKEDKFIIKAELPGIKREDIDISIY